MKDKLIKTSKEWAKHEKNTTQLKNKQKQPGKNHRTKHSRRKIQMVHTHVQRYWTPSITGRKWRPQGLLITPTRLVNRKQESCTVTSSGEERISRHFYMLLGLWKKISQDLKRLCPQPSQPFHSWVHTPERCLLAYVHQETNSRRLKAAFFSNSPQTEDIPKVHNKWYISIDSCNETTPQQ